MKFKFLVYSDFFNEKFGGHRILHKLGNTLHSLNEEVYSLCDPSEFVKYPKMNISDFNPEDTIVIYPEVVIGNPINAKYVTRWLLNDQKYEYGEGDLVFKLFNSGLSKKYAEHFLGIYYQDEVGGKQLDLYELRFVNNAKNYTDAANQFVSGLGSFLNMDKFRDTPFRYKASDFRLFTSDYSLYWFDYLAGYDVVFAEFGWNYSRQLNVALNRGAATIQDKEWGIIIAWTYNNPPYIESGEELYEDLVLAYDNGAKYIIVFDTNEDYTESILKEEHYDAIERFWQYTKEKQKNNIQTEKRVAFVLPKDYGYGFRGPEDKIWGLWEDDILSLEMSHHLGSLLEEYGTNLDIIYGDEITTHKEYKKYIFWNGIVISDD